MENKLPYNQKEEINHRRRSMSEEMLLNSIAFKVQENEDQRLLSGNRYDSLFARIEELKTIRLLSSHFSAGGSEHHGC